MKGQENIVNAINETARRTADNVLSEAQKNAEAEYSAFLARAEQREMAATEQADADAQKAYERRLTLAKLDCEKAELAAKQRAVAAVYDLAMKKLMQDKGYADFMAERVARECEDGDEIIVAACDKAKLNGAWLKKVVTLSKKKVTLSSETIECGGGAVLKNKLYDKDLTIEALAAELRNETESTVIKELFGDGDN